MEHAINYIKKKEELNKLYSSQSRKINLSSYIGDLEHTEFWLAGKY